MKVFYRRKILRRTRREDLRVRSRACCNGDGIFEGIRAYNGRVFPPEGTHRPPLLFPRKPSCYRPDAAREAHAGRRRCLPRNKLRDGYIRLVVTRGAGTLGLNPNRCKNPSVIIIADKIQVYPAELYERGMEIVTRPDRAEPSQRVEPGHQIVELPHKHPGEDRGEQQRLRGSVMLNADGFVAECTADNLFIAKAGRLMTPPLLGGRAVRHHAPDGDRAGRKSRPDRDRTEPHALRPV